MAYLRVSTEEQSLGPEAQRASIEGWAAQQGVQVLSWHLDQGVSGSTPIEGRPGLLAAFRSLEELEAGQLVVAKWDRLARDVIVSATAERLADRVGAQVTSADGVGAGTGPEAILMRGISAALAQYERALIAARTSAALRALRARGKRAGAVPLGYTLADDLKTLVPNLDEQASIELAKQLHTEGWSFREIAGRLEAVGHRPRGSCWHAMTVLRMVRC